MKLEEIALGALGVIAAVAIFKRASGPYNEETVGRYIGAFTPLGGGGIAIDPLQVTLDPNRAETIRRLQRQGWTYANGVLHL